mgnify:CR=1 FL=1
MLLIGCIHNDTKAENIMRTRFRALCMIISSEIHRIQIRPL